MNLNLFLFKPKKMKECLLNLNLIIFKKNLTKNNLIIVKEKESNLLNK